MIASHGDVSRAKCTRLFIEIALIPRAGVAKRATPNDVDSRRGSASATSLFLTSLLFAIALVRAGDSLRLTAVLPGIPASLAIGLGDHE